MTPTEHLKMAIELANYADQMPEGNRLNYAERAALLNYVGAICHSLLFLGELALAILKEESRREQKGGI